MRAAARSAYSRACAARGVEVTLTDAARELLGDLGYDPLRRAAAQRVIQKQLVDRLALALLDGEFHAGDTVRVDGADGHLVFERASAPAAASA